MHYLLYRESNPELTGPISVDVPTVEYLKYRGVGLHPTAATMLNEAVFGEQVSMNVAYY